MNKIKNITLLVLIFLTVTPIFVYAQGPENTSSKTQLDKPKGPGTSPDQPLIKCGNGQDLSLNPQTGLPNDTCDVDDINTLIMDILKLVFIFAGFIVAIMFMYAGFLLITSAGDTSKIQKARDIFRRVVIGFLIMFLSYILVKQLLKNIGAVDFFKNLIT
jgi:hypothetical protein